MINLFWQNANAFLDWFKLPYPKYIKPNGNNNNLHFKYFPGMKLGCLNFM